MADWVTISSLATASGTLVLAAATFAATRAANRAARVAEESLLAGTRPLLMPSRRDDSPLKVGFAEGHYVMTPVAFWQGAIRDPAEPDFSELSALITAPERLAIDLLYGDHQGYQRIISRFVLAPGNDGTWHAAPGRHWNVDRPDPR